MAYNPDKAFDDKDEVGLKAFLLYSFYCKHGGMDNNVVWVSLERAADFLEVVYENACRLNSILKKKGWIKHKNGKTILLKGFEHLSKTDEFNSFNESDVPKTDENDSNHSDKTDEFNSLSENETKKLTKTTVLEESGDAKTDENNSFDAEKDNFESSPKSKTDENNSLKLMKTTVAYKDEPAHLNQQEEILSKTKVSLKQNTLVRLSYLTEKEELELKKQICLKPKIPPITETEWQNILEIYEDWKTVFGKNNNSRLTVKRARAVLDRLRSSGKYTPAEIKTAIRGCRASPNHNGTREDQGGVVYDDLELICRSDDQIEKMNGYYEASRQLKKGVKNGNYKADKPDKPDNQQSSADVLRRIRANPSNLV